MGEGPVVIAYDGSPAAQEAIRESGALLRRRPAVVVVVWQQGQGFELIEVPITTIGLPPARIDVNTAIQIEQGAAERAQQLAQHGAQLAREAGFEAEGLAVADDTGVPVHETIVRVARERDAQAVVVGAHGHGALREVMLGHTSRDVIRHAPCPVIVVRRDRR